jgi:uncharacterized protein YuzE
MKAAYDREADALYLLFAKAEVVKTEEVRPGIVFDYDAAGRIVGIEILEAAKTIAGDPLNLGSLGESSREIP